MKNRSNKYNFFRTGVLLVSLSLCFAVKAFAVEEPYLNELKGSNVAVGKFFTVADEKFGSAAWSSIQQNISVDDIISFEINFDTSIYFYNQPFNCTIGFKIYIYGNSADTSLITDSTTHANINLNVIYDTVTGKPYKGIALYKFKDVHKFKVKILSISCPALSPIPAIFRLKGQIIINRKYNFTDNSTDVTRYSRVNANQLNLEWTPSNYPGAEMFDLEYAHIDYSSQVASTILASSLVNGLYNVNTDSLTKWFKNNSTRITTASSSYLLNIPYDSGFILFRIRGVQIHYPDQLRWEGNWNYSARHRDTTCSGSCPKGVIFFAGHETILNWQYSVVFAEEGKRKEVISYFDGSLRNRQSVTLNNTDNKNIVQETIYDALGRPAASILPAPTKDSTIHYFRGFNKNKEGDPYSFSDLLYNNCATLADSLSSSSGTGRYYSTNNEFLSNFYYANYIPNASGYPFAVTEYMADNTGRIKAQGGVGRIFQLDTTHATRYYYGKPTQTELDRLFGLEAGNASHYLKNMVMDANGQISVSYMDASGKTIATSLAGVTPSNVHSLPSNGQETSVQVSNELIQPGDFTRDPGSYSLSAIATFLAPITGSYVFNYRVDPLVYKKLFGPNKDTAICNDCYYDLEITVKDDCDNLIDRDTIAMGNVFDTSCVNIPDTLQGVMNVTLNKIGEYYITYKLVVSQDALAFYDSVHLVKNSDIKKLNYFLLEELKKTDFFGCYTSCETCFDKLGTRTEFIENFKSLYVTDSIIFGSEDSAWVSSLYDSLYTNCQAIQSQCAENICDEKLQLLKMDVTLGGQYALYDSTYNLLEPSINRLSMRSQINFFTNEFGVRDSVMLTGINGEDSILVDVKNLNDSLFIKYWKDVWADSLVRLHPEYCYYLWCIANDSSFEFDREIESWVDADSAIAKGWFDPGDYKALLDEDPFFKAGANGAAFYNKMKKSLQRFSRARIGLGQTEKNILQYVDVVLYCKTQANGWTACNPDSACRSRNREWFLYKHFYLNLKQKYYEEARRASSNPVFANCNNCYIGEDLLDETLNCADVSDFSLSSLGSSTYLEYRNGNDIVQRKTFVTIRKIRISPYQVTYPTIVFNAGDSILEVAATGYTADSILSVSCDTTSWQPFNDSTCNYFCPQGVYNPYDRDSISYYVEYGDPNISPSGTPGGYSNCQFYNVFDVQTGINSSCRFLNVWVCIKDSTYNGDYLPDSSFASSCPTDSNAVLYKYKQRRYPEYVNTITLTNQLLSNNPQQQIDGIEEQMTEQYAISCDAQADYWLSVLKRCGMSSSDSTTLRAALIDICTKGSSMNTPFGTSSIPSSISATYHSFEEAIEAILGPGAINDSCSAELLSMPYPYDRQPVLTERVISETDYGICQKLTLQRQDYISSGFSGSFHQWLINNFGNSYTLDSTELDDMLNACLNCNGILKNDIILPVLFDPQSRPCIKCDSINVAFDAFTDKFPAIDSTDDDYEILFTNFFNHRFGFALTYQQYKDFLDSCTVNPSYTAQLCNAPVTEDIAGDDNACLKDLFATALTNAVNIYMAYIDSVRRDFREAWLTKCMNAEPGLVMTANLYEYHYTLYYYDQSGNLVKTVPPEGVSFLGNSDIEQLQLIRNSANQYCSNNNSMVFTNGSVDYPGGTNASQLNVGANSFSIEYWINLNSYSDQGILSNNHYFSGGSPYNKGYSLAIISNKLDLLLGEDLSSKVHAQSPVLNSFIPLNTWNHVVIERIVAGTVKIFINGNEVPVSYTTNNPGTGNLDHGNTDLFYTGASNRGGSLSKLSSGKLRHLRVYKRALTSTEVRQNFMNYCGNPASEEALAFWETFNEGSFTTSGGNDYLYERIFNAAGQKSGTIAFETAANNTLVPAHRLVTTYQYNSLNQVLQQYSPDGDTSVFFYDRLGRLTVSQNMRQLYQASYDAGAERYSYTRYDSLGRITEVGEKSGDVEDIREINMLDTAEVIGWLNSGTNKQVTKTIYDNPVNLLLQSYSTSRKRVVASIYLDNATDTEGDSSLYVYDILGNVKTLVQHIKAFADFDDNQHKRKRRMDYDYDLVSGKVNLVSYEQGKGDQFFYKYQYDADNRVIRSYSSRDKLIWIEDASYNYYLHGPLARTELGQYKVQGVDYAYTLQGWLKGINSDSLSHAYDMAHDGMQDSLFARVSRDVFAFKLGYFDNDFIPINVTYGTAFTKKSYTPPGSLANTGNQLFNGNISYTTLALSKINGGATTGYSYGYDQLNRLVEMRQHTTNAAGGWSNTNIISAYAESISYDANGNILKYLRKGVNISGLPLDMDSLTYKYNRDGSGNLINNRLNHVRDQVSSSNYAVDIDNQTNNNYSYDRIGNLISDVAEGIDTVHWTVYGKIKKIVKDNGTVITYGYDPGGNRTSKTVNVNDTITITFYARDAQGNVLAVYTQKDEDALKWTEQHLYGSSRLGMFQWDTIIPTTPPVVDEDPIYDSLMLGSRIYELSNHLGNVLSTISDKKIGHDNSGVVDYYIVEVLSQNDYYPFGMIQPARKYSATDSYRYGFNGKENDNEVKGSGNQLDYGERIYDSRTGRFLSVDPLFEEYPWYTPYQFAGSSPIANIDLDGEEEKWYKLKLDEKTGKTTLTLTKENKKNSILWGLISWKAPQRNHIEYNGNNYTINVDGGVGSAGYTMFTDFTNNPEEALVKWDGILKTDEDAFTEYVVTSATVLTTGAYSTYRASGKNTSVTTPKSQQKTTPAPAQSGKPASQQKVLTNPKTASNVENQPKVNSGITDPAVNRVKLRKETIVKIKSNQPRNNKGEMIDPNTKQPLQAGKIDIGHKEGQEWRTRQQIHREKGSSRKEIINEENDENLYHLEDRSSNRSHKFEKKKG